MRDHAARQKPMTATATRMVKAIWHAYFVRTGIQLPGRILVWLDLLMSLNQRTWGLPTVLTLYLPLVQKAGLDGIAPLGQPIRESACDHF